MFRRQTSGSVICTSCGVLVGVNDDRCYNCGRRNPGLWGFAPALRALGHDMGFVPFVIGTCVVLYALTLVMSGGNIGMRGALSFLSPSIEATFVFGSSGAVPVFRFGRWWTVLSAGWLHGNALHIFLNMMVLRQVAPGVADLYGPGRMIIIYTAGGVGGFALSSFAGEFLPAILFLRGSSFTVGASASIAGLIGALLYYGHRSGSSMARSYATSYVLMFVVMGFLMAGIDNYAHAGGFGGGYLAARLLDPLKPERIDHVGIAFGCLAASILSVAVSVVHAYWPVG
ncbi:MAG TPA: rhomboid family intramembrane serine protease [Vicinamibacterales bacterium]